MKLRMTLAALVALVVAQAAPAHVITSAVRSGTTSNPAPVVVTRGLFNGVPAYVDRTHVYVNVDPLALGADYVMVSNSDKTVADYSLAVTVEVDSIVGLLIDWRVGDNDNSNPPTLGSGVMDWVAAMGFVDGAIMAEIDESNNGSIDQTFQIYIMNVAAGTTLNLGAQNDGGGRNMYGVAAIPEPATIGLIAVGLCGLLRRRR